MDVTTPPVFSPPVDPSELIVGELADVFVCLRGPCSHYMEQTEPAEVHNVEEGLLQTTRTCLVKTGADLTEQTVYDCNLWSPITAASVAERTAAREAYWAANPQHDPRTADTTRLTQIRRGK